MTEFYRSRDLLAYHAHIRSRGGSYRQSGTGSRLHISVRYQCICAQHIGSNRGTANMQCGWVYMTQTNQLALTATIFYR